MKVTKMIAKYKVESDKVINKTREIPIDKELKWLNYTINNFEKEIEQLKKKLRQNTDCSVVVKLQEKLIGSKCNLESDLKALHSIKEKIKYKERKIQYCQVKSNNYIQCESELEIIANAIFAENNKAKCMETQLQNSANQIKQKQELINEINNKITKMNLYNGKKSEKVLVVNEPYDFSKSNQVILLKNEYNSLKKEYEAELRNNIKEKKYITNEILKTKRIIDFNTKKASVCTSTNNDSDKSHYRVYSVSVLKHAKRVCSMINDQKRVDFKSNKYTHSFVK